MDTSICSEEELEKIRAENRRNFPQAYLWLEEYRKVFGPKVKLIWAEENGREIGKRPVWNVK